MAHRDVCGNDLAVGDYIAYATRWGSHLAVKIGRVDAVLPGGKIQATVAERFGLTGRWERQPKKSVISKLTYTCVVRDVPEHLRKLLT